MKKKFVEEFYRNRDETLEIILKDKISFYDYIKFWARNLGYHTVDNLITIYSYNPKGTMFATFDEWNNEIIDRKIKRYSHGIPILQNGYKSYVFDISQTWGKPINLWKYNKSYEEDLIKIYNND